MTLINDPDLNPINATYNMAVKGFLAYSAVPTPAVGDKYLAKDGNFPTNAAHTTFMAAGSLALCVATAPDVWVALNAPNGMRLADSSTGIIWLRSPSTNTSYPGWDPIEAWLDIVADPNAADVSGPLNTLFTTVAAISNSIPVYLGPTQNLASWPFTPKGWQITHAVTNKAANPVICRAPIYWMGTTTGDVALTVGDPTRPNESSTAMRSEYWLEYSNNYTSNYNTLTTGLQIVNLSGTRFTVKSRFFWMGVEVKAIGGANNGCGFNDIDVMSVYGCLKGVGWTANTGFINENTFHMGDMSHNIVTDVGSVAMLRINFTVGEANGNKWYSGPGFEATAESTGSNFIELVGTATGNAVYANEFHGIRFDGPVVPTFINCGGSFSMAGNLFNIAYFQPGSFPSFAGSNAAAVTACSLNNFEFPLDDPRAGRFDGQPLVKIGRSNMTQRTDTDGVRIQAPARGKFYLRQNPVFFNLSPWQNETKGGYGQLTADSIQLIPGAIAILGVFIDVRNTPRKFLNKLLFRVNLGTDPASAARIGMTVFGPDGQTFIGSANDVQTQSDGSLNGMTYSGPGWGYGADSTQKNASFEVSWSSNVGFIYLSCTGGTATANIVDMAVYAPADSGVVPLYNSLDIPFIPGVSGPPPVSPAGMGAALLGQDPVRSAGSDDHGDHAGQSGCGHDRGGTRLLDRPGGLPQRRRRHDAGQCAALHRHGDEHDDLQSGRRYDRLQRLHRRRRRVAGLHPARSDGAGHAADRCDRHGGGVGADRVRHLGGAQLLTRPSNATAPGRNRARWTVDLISYLRKEPKHDPRQRRRPRSHQRHL